MDWNHFWWSILSSLSQRRPDTLSRTTPQWSLFSLKSQTLSAPILVQWVPCPCFQCMKIRLLFRNEFYPIVSYLVLAFDHDGACGHRCVTVEQPQYVENRLLFICWTRAQPDWAYGFPDRTGPDTQICRTGPEEWKSRKNKFVHFWENLRGANLSDDIACNPCTFLNMKHF